MFKLFVIFLLLVASAQAAEPNLKDLKWNRYEKNGFTILSIKEGDGEWLLQNVESIKSESLKQWGFPDTKFLKECRIFLVPDKTTLKRLFDLEEPKIEVKKDVIVIWTRLGEDANIVPCLAQAALAEFEIANNISLGTWFKHGAGQLGQSNKDIRRNVASIIDYLAKDEPIFISQKLFSTTEDEFDNLNVNDKLLFNKQAMLACLMLRKEFGEAKLQGFLRLTNRNNSDIVMKTVYGFRNCSHFDKQYIRYMRDLSTDVLVRTPDSYLEIRSVQ